MAMLGQLSDLLGRLPPSSFRRSRSPAERARHPQVTGCVVRIGLSQANHKLYRLAEVVAVEAAPPVATLIKPADTSLPPGRVRSMFKKLDANGKPLSFHGKVLHMTGPFEGLRIPVVAFPHTKVGSLAPRTLEVMESYGYERVRQSYALWQE